MDYDYDSYRMSSEYEEYRSEKQAGKYSVDFTPRKVNDKLFLVFILVALFSAALTFNSENFKFGVFVVIGTIMWGICHFYKSTDYANYCEWRNLKHTVMYEQKKAKDLEELAIAQKKAEEEEAYIELQKRILYKIDKWLDNQLKC